MVDKPTRAVGARPLHWLHYPRLRVLRHVGRLCKIPFVEILEKVRPILDSFSDTGVMFRRFMTILLEGDESIFRFVLQNAQKDIRYYTDMARNLPSTAFIAESIHQTYVMASNLGHGNEYVPRLMRILAEINDAKLDAAGTGAGRIGL